MKRVSVLICALLVLIGLFSLNYVSAEFGSSTCPSGMVSLWKFDGE